MVQVVVRIKASSICGSDVRAIYREHLGKGAEGYIDGIVAGHEPSGQAESIGTGVTTVRPGDRVAIYHIAGADSPRLPCSLMMGTSPVRAGLRLAARRRPR
jgi:threonine dehydrogenase-like Zn-dependent dehydrogenase